ncbi:MAG: DUF4410 domain-containing protein [Desulfuromonadales bacterium]|nr:MAG: DUF4410 domain-containing protein [Desulfuromonadales bacterium]
MKTLRPFAALIASFAILAIAGCAPTNVAVTSEYGGQLQQPEKFLVYDFAVSPDEVKLDDGISSKVKDLVGGTKTPKADQELKVGRAVTDALAKKLVANLRKLGYPAERAFDFPPKPGNLLVIEGQIISIDEGNQAERAVVGLGVGRSDVKTTTQIYDIQPSGRRLVEEFQTDAKSGYKPGMLETEGASAVAGHWAVGLAVGAGLTVASEKFGANVDADAERTAKDIAQQLNDFFMSKGWKPTINQ